MVAVEVTLVNHTEAPIGNICVGEKVFFNTRSLVSPTDWIVWLLQEVFSHNVGLNFKIILI